MYLKKAYTLREKLLEKLDAFIITYTQEEKLFSNAAIFDVESIWVLTDDLKATEKLLELENISPFPSKISSNSPDDPIFLCEKNYQNSF